MQWFRYILTVQLVLTLPGMLSSASAQITLEQRRELADMTKTVSQASSLIRKKDYEEAGKVLSEVETRLQEFSTANMVPLTDPILRRIVLTLTKQKERLMKATGMDEEGDSSEVSFMKEIAPLINSRCVSCHGEQRQRANLRLDNFAGWRAGSKSGRLLTPGNTLQSLIMARVNAPQDKGGMPPNGAALTDEEKQLLGRWIDQGAKFDGASENTSFADLIYEEESKNVMIPRPKGGEQVLFTRDIAPWFANLCLRCHNSRRKSGGLSVETFFDIMKGGDSGEVIIPGDMENSRLFRLVGGLELPRMPQGQARITRKNYEDLKQWFREGNPFDGNDPRTRITEYVPSETELAMDRFSQMSDLQLQELRETTTEEQYRKAISTDPHPTVKTEDFLIVGNVDEKRLEQVRRWAEEALQTVRKDFGNDPRPWRGRLAIFVLKDQFSYSEFNEMVERRRLDPDLTGHSKVTLGQEQAYVALQDLGDNPSKGPSLQASLIDHLTGAYLSRSGKPIPQWIVRGTGLAFAENALPNPERSDELMSTARKLAGAVPRPQEIFDNGTFSPAGTEAVGYALVRYLIANGGAAKFGRFVSAIEGGTSQGEALQSVYGVSPTKLAESFLTALQSR